MNLPQLLSRIAFFLSVLAFSLTFGLQAQASTNPLSFSPSSLRFGDVVVGQSESLPINLTNRSTSSVSISTLSASAGYSVGHPSLPQTLGAGKTLALTVTFRPTGSTSEPGTLLINGKTAIDLHGAGTSNKTVVPTPPSISFGNIQTGSTAVSRVTVTNNKSGNTTLSSTVIKGTGFTVQGLTLPLTLTPGQSFTFTLAFSPKSAGSISGSFQALSPRNSTSVSIPLSGTGTATTAQLSLSPANISFGNVTVGSSATQSGKLTAVGASVTITADSSTNSQFSLSGLSFPMTIAAGQSVPFTVAFTPQSSGSASANLSFANNVSTVSESLTGSGVAVASHSVSLTWDPSTSQVNGYNVYRSGTTGGPYAKMNSGIDAGTSYVDSSVAASHTYYYVTTAVNSNGQESSYSNQVQVSVP
jgi:hypothetical protein